MVESIGAKPVGEDRRVTPLAPVVAAAPVAIEAATPRSDETAAAATLARRLGAAPPVDAERVARIKQAIADGSFPILPATIADRMLAFTLEWRPDDARD